MSKERELLARVLTSELWSVQEELQAEIKKLLAQPEQEQEQEPVAWMYKQMDCYGEWGTIFKVDKPYISYHDIKDIVPVYTAPPKLERINHDDILDRSIDGSFEYRDGFMDGVMFAENHHGIGGEE